MRVTLLGAGASAGVPMIGGPDGRGDWGVCDRNEPRNRRTRSSAVLDAGQGGLLIDTGPDLREQLLSCGISQIAAILYTHDHADHITGLDDVRILNRIAGRPLPALATEKVLEDLQTRFDYAFRPWKPPGFYRPVMEPRAVAAGDTVDVAGMQVRLFEQDHGFATTLGLRVGDFAYCTDVVGLAPDALAQLAGLDTLVISCFQRGPHNSHAPLPVVLDWIAQLQPRRAILTHMGTDMDWAWMQANLPAGVEPAYDGMVIEFG